MEFQPPPEVLEHRKPEHDVHPLLYSRWSSRAMSGEAVTEQELGPLFEAARWAPSSFNAQPWRFVYSLRDDENWTAYLEAIFEKNRAWAQDAGALILLVSRKNFEHNEQPALTHGFDAGAAWQNLALEGARKNFVIHAMQGFDHEKARAMAGVPEGFETQIMIAVGRPGDKARLPEMFREKDFPSGRKSLSELVMRGKFSAG